MDYGKLGKQLADECEQYWAWWHDKNKIGIGHPGTELIRDMYYCILVRKHIKELEDE